MLELMQGKIRRTLSHFLQKMGNFLKMIIFYSNRLKSDNLSKNDHLRKFSQFVEKMTKEIPDFPSVVQYTLKYSDFNFVKMR